MSKVLAANLLTVFILTKLTRNRNRTDFFYYGMGFVAT